jgi:PTS system mannose-specific IIA component
MFLEDQKVEVVTGVNLPMVIKVASQTGKESLAEIAHRVCEQGRQGIYMASELLMPPAKPGRA